MPIKADREYRILTTPLERAEEGEYIVRGYATTYSDPYVLFSEDGVDYTEEVARDAFREADMTDVIMQYDHTGKVLARTSNGTLHLTSDEHGLKITADLSKTAASRDLYDEIATGLVTKMSMAFTVAEDEYLPQEHRRVIKKVKKLYDVSAVSIPANPGTEIGIAARTLLDGEIQRERAERLRQVKRARQKEVLKLKLRIGGYINDEH